jgi:hypothetical protein
MTWQQPPGAQSPQGYPQHQQPTPKKGPGPLAIIALIFGCLVVTGMMCGALKGARKNAEERENKRAKAEASAPSSAPEAYIPRPITGEDGFLYCSLDERGPVFATEEDFRWFQRVAAAKNQAELKRLEAKAKFPVVGAGITVLDTSFLGWSKVRVNNSSLVGTEGYTVTGCTFKVHPRASPSAPAPSSAPSAR